MSEFGLFTRVEGTRNLKGLLLPLGETSRMSASNTEPIYFEAGAIKLPRDPAVVTLNIGHDRFNPIGRAVSLEETEAGIVAEFEVANTDEGDAFLANPLRKLSAEIAGIIRDSVDAAKGVAGRLTGAAAVTEGAFESAALFAIADEEEPDELAELNARVEALRVVVAELTQTPESTPVDEETEPEIPATEEEETVAEATAPNTLAPTGEDRKMDANSVFAAITAAKGTFGDAQAEEMLAALADIKISGSGALPASGVLQPTWLGEVWAGRDYERRYHSLIKNGTITALEEKGFTLSTGSELVQSWAGNKAELPTGNATTSVVSGDPLVKWGFAADIAQEFYLIPAGQPVIEAFIREILRSYSRVTDKYALQKIYAAAGVAIEAEDFPTAYNDSLGKLIQGIDAIDDTDVSPTFAVVAPDVYRELRFTPKDELPEFVTFQVGRQGGTADGVQIVRDKAGVLAAGEVLVGSRDAAHINELPNSPVRFDALDVAHGGIDKSFIAMSQYMTEYADGLVLIGDAVAP